MEVLIALVPLIAGLIKAAQLFIQTRVTPQQLNNVQSFAHTVVAAAEEVGNALDLESDQKYDYAETALIAGAKRLGVKLKPEEANAFIHAILVQLHVAEAEAVVGDEGGAHLAAA